MVGTPKKLDWTQRYLGNKFRIVQPCVDIISLVAMLTFSFFLGGLVLPLSIIGQFFLGMIGGALIAGLLLGHYGKIGEFIGRFPYAATFVAICVIFFVDFQY